MKSIAAKCTWLLIVVILISCQSEKEYQKTLNTGNLKSYFINVDANKNTVFRTPKGAVIQIKKGTFSNNVELEIKEAYTLKDMVVAGLTTESKGKPLSSGGMLYINTRDQSTPILNYPISITIPSPTIDSSMKLYKGIVQSDSSVDWNPMDTVKPVGQNDYETGRVIFQRNCANCHGIYKTITGPALARIEYRGPWKSRAELHRFINSPANYFPRTVYTMELLRVYRQIMPNQLLSDRDIDLVLDYIKKAEKNPLADENLYNSDSLRLANNNLKENPPCFDTLYSDEKDTAYISNSTVLNNNMDTSFNTGILNLDELDSTKVLQWREDIKQKGFTDSDISDGGYRFNIKTLGWYNVDMEIKGLEHTTRCKIAVDVPNSQFTNISVYAFFPEHKLMLPGRLRDDGNYYFGDDDSLSLYLKEKATVLAFGNKGETFFYGTAHFQVNTYQKINIKLQASTQTDLINAINNEKLEGINMDVIKRNMEVIPCEWNNNKDTLSENDFIINR